MTRWDWWMEIGMPFVAISALLVALVIGGWIVPEGAYPVTP